MESELTELGGMGAPGAGGGAKQKRIQALIPSPKKNCRAGSSALKIKTLPSAFCLILNGENVA